MTDQAAEGSVGQDAAPAGNPETQQQAPEKGSAGNAVDWFSGLSEGNRKTVEAKGWKAGDDVIASYTELEKLTGDSLKPPGKDATPEELDKFFDKLGRPESPDKYEFKMPEGLPEDFAYSSEFADQAKGFFHKARLTPAQAQAVHDGYVQVSAQAAKAQAEAQGEAAAQTTRELVKEWGDMKSPAFKEQKTLADIAAKELGFLDAFKEAGVVLPDGAYTHPVIAKGLAQIGQAMFREKRLDGGDPSEGRNPWKAETVNLTEQSKITAKDPERARRLMREAGKDPARIRL